MSLRQLPHALRQHWRRIFRLSAPFVLVLLGRALLGCGAEVPKTAPQVSPLQPVDIAARHRKAIEQRRVTDPEGRLLESDQSVAGLTLPRGLTQTHALEHAFYYRSHASIEQLQQFFGTRLLTGQVEQGGMGTVTYVEAQPRQLKKKAFITVRIGPAPGSRDQREVYIVETPMMPVTYPSEAEARAKLDDLRRYAD